MIEAILRHYLQSRWRRLIVLILISALGLLVILPSADEYFASSARRSRLVAELAEVRLSVGRLGRLREMAATKQTALAELEAWTVPQEKLNVFRGKVVEMARDTGCQIRRVSVGEARERPWRQGRDPLVENPAQGEVESPHRLKMQSMSLMVSGPLPATRDFIQRLASSQELLHLGQFTLQPVEADGREISLEVDIMLFDLAEAPPASAKG
jgi:hypothetical protein